MLDVIDELEQDVGTSLYGRVIYEAMTGGETDPAVAARSSKSAGVATTWRATEKIVFSTTLAEVTTMRTRLERSFDPDLVRRIEDGAATDLHVSGAGVAAAA